MRKIVSLAVGNFKNIRRDLILGMVLFAPILLAMLMRAGLPFMARFIHLNFNFDLIPHYPFVVGLLLLASPLMVGALVGFLILDEKDDQILPYLSVTPLQKKGYILYRLAAPVVLSVILNFVMLLLLAGHGSYWLYFFAGTLTHLVYIHLLLRRFQ